MVFHIEHTTEYVYSAAATESFSEIRLRPRDSLRQQVSRHRTQVTPAAPVESYLDYFGNYVETVSVPFRHNKLAVTSSCDVITNPFFDAISGLDLTLSEARQLYTHRRRELHDFLRPSRFIVINPETLDLAADLLRPTGHFAESVKALNHHVF